jgi:hypothetical protein
MSFVTVAVLMYVPGFVAVFLLHLFYLPMVTFGLAISRSVAWPLWIAFGWPHGAPLPMD